MTNLILDTMEPISAEHLRSLDAYKKRFEDAGVGKVRESFILTSQITLWILDYNDGTVSAWAYYPKSGCESFIATETYSFVTKNHEEFVQRCIDNLLHRHDWFDRDVMLLIESRGGKSVQRKRA